jgi:hypothetical protein
MLDPNPHIIEPETEDPIFPVDDDIFRGAEMTPRPEGGIVPDIPDDDELTEDNRRPFSEKG